MARAKQSAAIGCPAWTDEEAECACGIRGVLIQISRLPTTCAVSVLAIFLVFTACAPAYHEPAELPAQCAAEVEPEPSAEPDPAPATPYALYASESLDPSAIEAAHTRQAGRILNERLGDEIFVWSGFAPYDDLGCNTVLVTRGAETVLYAEGCRWVIELEEGGLTGDDEVRQLSGLLALTLAGAP